MNTNRIAYSLRIYGFAVCILGIIGAITIYSGLDGEFDGAIVGPIVVGVVFYNLIFGSLLLGFSEVIRLLQEISINSQQAANQSKIAVDKNQLPPL